MKDARTPLVARLSSATELPPETVSDALSEPPDAKLGDYAFPCFPLARTWRKNPAQIAGEIAERLACDDVIAEAKAAGPYVNIRLNRGPFLDTVMSDLGSDGERYGAGDTGEGRRVVIDYSSPNMAKPFHVGHVSTTIIGGSLSNLFEFSGCDVVRVNHLGDWGTPIGQQIVAFRRWGDADKLDAHPISHMVELYQRFHREKAEHPELEDESREWFRRLEEGDQEARGFWEHIRAVSIAELERAYKRLGVRFDHYHGEAFYENMLADTVKLAEERSVTEASDGALIIPLDSVGIETPVILRKSDGATIYATRDLTAAMFRAREYEFDQNIYVVARDQELHFRQLFAALKLMGFDWAEKCHHVMFGHVHGMSTRKGGAILMDELLDEAVAKAEQIIRGNAESMFSDLSEDDIDEVAESVGVGAIIFSMLNRKRGKDIEFSWETTLTFNGETGPYVQYAHARLCSILRKAGREVPESPDLSLLTHDAEWALVKQLERFGREVMAACEQYEPSFIVRYLLELSQSFTRFYDQCRVLTDDDALTGARLALVDAVRQVIKTGLGLLCIKAPERM